MLTQYFTGSLKEPTYPLQKEALVMGIFDVQ